MLKYQELINKMTLEEKASLLSGKDFWQTRDIKKYGIPSMFLADGPHGIRKQMADADHLGLNPSYEATSFPTSVSMANTFDVDLIQRVGIALGKEATGQRVSVLLGPGTNIKRDPRCGRNFEYFSEDPYLAGMMTAAHISGVQQSGVSACAKHFAVNNQEFRRLVIDAVVDERALREIYLQPFEIAVKQGNTKTIMSAYNKVNGQYANENEYILNKVLREDWNYEGLVVTDWGGNNDRVLAMKCNSDLEMPTTASETNYDVVRAVESGDLDEAQLDKVVDRILTIIFDTEKAFENVEEVDFNAHHQLAREVLESAAVLLENDGVLPLTGNEKVCIIGDFADKPRIQGGGSSTVNPTSIDKTTDFISQHTINYVGYEQGFKRYGKKSSKLVKKAVELANKSDVILLYLGLDEISEVEGIDRKDLKFPENQINLIEELKKTGKKIVLILTSGSTIELDFIENANAVIHGYLPGQAGMSGLLNLVYGKVNPSGRLSESIAYKLEDYPATPYFLKDDNIAEYRESIFVGYRYFNTRGVKVRYPFGYGLSYTKFSKEVVKLDDTGITVRIKNVGKHPGKDVIQMYIGKKDSDIFRASKELKGFVKVHLEVDEEKEVKIPFDDYSFRYFDISTSKFEVEGGDYQIYLGNSVEDIYYEGSLIVEGSNIKPYELDQLVNYFKADVHNITDLEFSELLRREIPKVEKARTKRGKIIVDLETTVADLREARGWTGRFLSFAVRNGSKFLMKIGKKTLGLTLIMGVYNQPMRTLSRMTGGMIDMKQLNGLIIMFNGKFFKGLRAFMKAGKQKKKLLKYEKERVKKTEVTT